MQQIKRLILGLAAIMVLAPMLSMASDPLPQCNPCPDSVSLHAR